MNLIPTKLIPSGFDAFTVGAFIFIHPDKLTCQDLIEHESIHVEQWKRSPWLHHFKYLLSRKYRLACEVEAYRHQLKFAPDLNHFAERLANGYWLGISEAEAKEFLNG